MPAAARWMLSALLVAVFGGLLTLYSPCFGYDYDVGDMPVAWLAAGLVLAGLLYCIGLPRLISSSSTINVGERRLITLCIVAAGLAVRLALFASEPILEDDYQRYLWDGAVTASGHNPYAAAPKDALTKDNDLNRLGQESGPVINRVNHPDLKTIYPPVAQAAFALAYAIRPWSLAAWRSVLLAFDFATLALILLLLREVGRSPLWSALYWWNPLVIKELFNSAHMEAVVLPFVLGALWLAIRKRHVLATASLAMAVGAKIWPGLLLPLILRGCSSNRRTLLYAVLVFAALVALCAAPICLGGLDSNSGFAAYASHWQTNSALFPALERATAMVLSLAALPSEMAGVATRGILALCIVALSVSVSVKRLESPDDLVYRASLVVAALVLLSPAQFPWYAVWFAPFLPFRPWFGFLLLTATVPLYYLSFHFLAQYRPDIFDDGVVWIIWVPVWTALLIEAVQRRKTPAAQAPAHV